VVANLFLDKAHPPTAETVDAALGRRASYLGDFKRAIPEPVTEEWKHYGQKSGWTLKLLVRAKRNLCFIVVGQGAYAVGFVFGDKAVAAVEQSGLPADLVAQLVNARRYAEGRGIRLEVRTRQDLAHAIRLLEIKRTT
jgi:hypothetical protein